MALEKGLVSATSVPLLICSPKTGPEKGASAQDLSLTLPLDIFSGGRSLDSFQIPVLILYLGLCILE